MEEKSKVAKISERDMGSSVSRRRMKCSHSSTARRVA